MEFLIQNATQRKNSVVPGENIQPVPAGNAAIITTDKKMRVAYLGFCVGLALYDRISEVGGDCFIFFYLSLLTMDSRKNRIVMRRQDFSSLLKPLFRQERSRRGWRLV